MKEPSPKEKTEGKSMEKNGINRMFFSIILLHIAVVFLLMLIPNITASIITISITENLLLSELMILGPGLVYLLLKKRNYGAAGLTYGNRLGFHKIRISTFFLTILFTFLVMPLTTLCNAISMLFVDNTMLMISPQMLSMPFVLMLFLVAVYGPFCEEFVFRGIVYGGYRRQGSTCGAVLLSGLLFGLMHLNFNQAGYAFVMGIALAVLMEASGSIWTSILCHFIFNAQSVCLLYLENYFMPEFFQQQLQMDISKEQLYLTISVYFVLAAITTAIAVCVLCAIAKNEGRSEQLKKVLPGKGEKKTHLFSPILILGIITCLAYMIFEVVITMMHA